MIDFEKEEKDLEKIVIHFHDELKNLRIGRAHISMVEHVMVESYGSLVPLPHIASISTPDPRTIVIKPWDKASLVSLERAIQGANLGFQIIAEKDQVRLSLPPLTEERRKEMVKLIGKKTEESRIALRRSRDIIWKTIQEESREGKISEDQKFVQKEKMERMVEAMNERIGEAARKKEKEIMEY